ncbi:MAG: DNA repair protein RecN [Xanthomonadales bacterium]|nr:DNA repair protein RecN [Xanthomonadales bacterium]
MASSDRRHSMLNFLQIRDYAIVDSLDMDFTRGFTCITGETGAGKSILVGALGLLSGNRADTGAIRQGQEKAELVAEFELEDGCPALDWLRETELDDGRNCLLRRIIHRNGRSRAWINGTAVTLAQLSELGELLVEIHGQNEHLRLTRSRQQFELLDGADSHEPERLEVRDRYFAWQELEMEKQSLLALAPLDAGDLELLRHQVNELECGMIPAAEFTRLENEHRKLAHGGEIVAMLESALQTVHSERSGSSAKFYRAAAELEEHASLDKDIAAAASLLKEAAIVCDEAGASIQSALSRMDLSPERLAELEQKLAAQHDLARKHRVEPEQLDSVYRQLQQRIEQTASQEKRLAGIDAELENALRAYRRSALLLHACRRQRADGISRDVTDLMQDLGMAGGRFEIAVRLDDQAAPSARGDDRLALNVSANRGTEPGPLRKVASGGELSRISLAVKIVARQHAAPATQVFDEVDAGIGGATASAVGSLLKNLSAGGQALCVTHLAQVAVFADQQILVCKQPGTATSSVETRLLDKENRIDEVARMLGGALSEQSRAHAAELLGATQAVRH